MTDKGKLLLVTFYCSRGSREGLGEWNPQMRRSKVSCNSHLPSKHKSGYALKVKKSHLRAMAYNPKGKLHMVEKLHVVEIGFFS